MPAETMEAVAYLLGNQAGGTVIDDEPGQPGRPARLRAYFPANPEGEARLAAVREALRAFPSYFPQSLSQRSGDGPDWWVENVRTVNEADWALAWKAYFKPFRVGRRLVVVPSWEEYRPGPGDVVLRLDPGMAFGTGTHPSTALCLECVERLVRPGMHVLDVGTGSGILSIAAALLGAPRVVALDIDPVAARVARDNVLANGLSALVRVREGEAADQPPAANDLVLANLTADIHATVHADLARALRPGGKLVAGGIVTGEAGRVIDLFTRDGLEFRERLEKEGWAALVLVRKPSAVIQADFREPGRRGRPGTGK